MQMSVNVAGTLLDVDSEHRSTLSPRVKLHASILAALNLIPSGLSENLLRADMNGYYLSLFLFSHSSLYLLFILSYFIGSSKTILTKAGIFPTSATSRILFLIASGIRHPFSIALMASNSFFFIVLYRDNVPTATFSVLLYLMLIFAITLLASLCFLFAERRKQSAGILLALAAMMIAIGLAGSLVFHQESLLAFIPVMNLCVDGILASRNGAYLQAAMRLFGLAFVPVVAFVVGRKFV